MQKLELQMLWRSNECVLQARNQRGAGGALPLLQNVRPPRKNVLDMD